MRNVVRHLGSFVAPIVMGLVLPLVIVRAERGSIQRALGSQPAGLVILGSTISFAGLGIVIATIRLFIRLGRGTIMPWDPTRNLVVAGPYRYVRNPMILGVLAVEAGWAIACASPGLATLAAFFFALNTVYFIYSEEPGLEKRFGRAYVEYKQNVPRWLPRLRPWQPSS